MKENDMEPTDCTKITCIRLWVTPEDRDCACIGTRCSQWIPTTHGSPAADNVGMCADNGKRLMIDRSAP